MCNLHHLTSSVCERQDMKADINMYNACTVRSDHTGRQHTYTDSQTDGIVGKVVQEASGTWGWAHFPSVFTVCFIQSRRGGTQPIAAEEESGRSHVRPKHGLAAFLNAGHVRARWRPGHRIYGRTTNRTERQILSKMHFSSSVICSTSTFSMAYCAYYFCSMHKQYFNMASKCKCPIFATLQILKKTISNQSLLL